MRQRRLLGLLHRAYNKGSVELSCETWFMTDRQGNRGTPSTFKRTRLVIAEDETLLAKVLPKLLHIVSSGRSEVVQICLTRSQLFETLKKTAPDVLLCDIWMPNRSGELPVPCDTLTLKAFKRQSPTTAILLMSGKSDAALAKSLLDAGASGLLGKGVVPEQIWWAIERVRQGNSYIAPRFQAAIDRLNTGSDESIRTQLLKGRRGDVLRLLLEGFSPTEIAGLLPVGKKYVDKKIREIKSVLGVETHIRILHACAALEITKVSS